MVRRDWWWEMRKGGGKAKGAAFERRIAKTLSLWLTGGQDPNELIWSVSSGGWRVKEEGEQGWRQVGDLAPNGAIGEQFRYRFAVECKHHKVLDFWHTFTARPAENLQGWWYHLKQECQPYTHLQPMLVVKMNNRPALVGCKMGAISPMNAVYPGLRLKIDRLNIITFITLDSFLQLNPELFL